MLYTVGTHISFRDKDFPETPEPKRRLYLPGTKILIVDWVPSLSTLVVAPA